MNQQQASQNVKVLYLFSFFWMFTLVIPILVPYMTDKGLSMKQFMELQAIFGLATATLEVPSRVIWPISGAIGAMVFAQTYFTRIGDSIRRYQ